MVHSFANSKHAIGDQSVQFWLFEMERYYSEIGISLSNISIEHSFYGLAFHFISAKNTEFWPEDIVWDVKHSIDGIAKIKSFRCHYLYILFSYLHKQSCTLVKSVLVVDAECRWLDANMRTFIGHNIMKVYEFIIVPPGYLLGHLAHSTMCDVYPICPYTIVHLGIIVCT